MRTITVPAPIPGLTGSAFWNEIMPWVRIEVYDRDGSARQPRVRIELDRKTPLELERKALAYTAPCCRCGALINPFRSRSADSKRSDQRRGDVYYAPACPLQENIGCSRGKEARDEYTRIKRALRPDLD